MVEDRQSCLSGSCPELRQDRTGRIACPPLESGTRGDSRRLDPEDIWPWRGELAVAPDANRCSTVFREPCFSVARFAPVNFRAVRCRSHRCSSTFETSQWLSSPGT